MATKVYTLYQLGRAGDSQLFDLTQKSKLIRTGVKIGEDLAQTYNDNAKDSGKYYELDEAESERLFGKEKQIIKEETKAEAPVIVEQEQPEQKKYNARKEKMITAGYVFNSETNVFIKG